MPRSCSICDSPHRRAVDQKLKSGSTQDDVRRWLAEVGLEVHRTAVGRHAKHALPTLDRQAGPKPSSEDFLTVVRDRVQANVEAGVLEPSVTHGLQAQAQLDHRNERFADRQLMARIALALTGNVALPQVRVLSPEDQELEDERLELESEFRLLLTPGADPLANRIPSATDRRAAIREGH